MKGSASKAGLFKPENCVSEAGPGSICRFLACHFRPLSSGEQGDKVVPEHAEQLPQLSSISKHPSPNTCTGFLPQACNNIAVPV